PHPHSVPLPHASVGDVDVGDGGGEGVEKSNTEMVVMAPSSNSSSSSSFSSRTTKVAQHNHLLSLVGLQMILAIALWYLFSLVGLYLNKYVISTLHIEVTLLSTIQVLSTFCCGGIHVGLLRCFDHHCAGSSSGTSTPSLHETTSPGLMNSKHL